MKFISVFRGRVSVDRIACVTACDLKAHNKHIPCYILLDDKDRELGHVSGHQLDELEKSARRVVPNTIGTKGVALVCGMSGEKLTASWSDVPVVGWEIIEGAGADEMPTAIPVFAETPASNYWLFTEHLDGTLVEWCVWTGRSRTFANRAEVEEEKITVEAAA